MSRKIRKTRRQSRKNPVAPRLIIYLRVRQHPLYKDNHYCGIEGIIEYMDSRFLGHHHCIINPAGKIYITSAAVPAMNDATIYLWGSHFAERFNTFTHYFALDLHSAEKRLTVILHFLQEWAQTWGWEDYPPSSALEEIEEPFTKVTKETLIEQGFKRYEF